MTSNNYINPANDTKNILFEFSNKDTGNQRTKKINGNNLISKILRARDNRIIPSTSSN